MAGSRRSPWPRVALVTGGDPSRRTGGYLYNRHVTDALTLVEGGPGVEQVILPDGPPGVVADVLRARLAASPPAIAIVDSIVVPATALAIEAIQRELGIRVVALMHMLPSDTGAGPHPPAPSPFLGKWLGGEAGAERPFVLLPSLFRQKWRGAGGEARHGRAASSLGEIGMRDVVDLERRLLAVADRVVAVSPALRTRLIRAGADPARVVVIPPGRDSCLPLRAYQGLALDPRPASPPRFLSVANWSEPKGIHLVVEALARLDPPAILDLVGEPGVGSYPRRVRELIARHQLGERVQIHGSLAADALAERYAAADVFVLPSRSEGFGTVYAEAMSFGKPVVAARVGPIPWLVEAGCGLLVPPDDVAALAAAMRTLAEDAGRRQRLGENARRRAERLPTWRESEEAFRDVVRDLLAGTG